MGFVERFREKRGTNGTQNRWSKRRISLKSKFDPRGSPGHENLPRTSEHSDYCRSIFLVEEESVSKLLDTCKGLRTKLIFYQSDD